MRASLVLPLGLSCLMILLFSCNNPFSSGHRNKQQQISYDYQVSKARHYTARHSDCCLIFADSAIRILAKSNENDTGIIHMMQLKADFWRKKGNSDSTIATLKAAHKLAINAFLTLILTQK